MPQPTVRRVLVTALTVGLLGLLPGAAFAHERHEVEPGDTLIDIAEEFDLPDGAWQAIARDNADVINDPDLLYVGTTLRVPVTPESLDLDSLPAGVPGQAATSDTGAQSTDEQSGTAVDTSGGADQGTWERLAECESGGQWSLDGTYDGGLQFHPDTWTAYGGGDFATYAYQASKSQQIAVAERVLAQQGWDAWPACASELGLR